MARNRPFKKGPPRLRFRQQPVETSSIIAGTLPIVVWRVKPQRKPSRAQSRIVTPPPVYTSANKRPNVVRRATAQPKPTRAQSRLLKPAAIVAPPPITPIVIQAKRAKPPTRAQRSGSSPAPTYNSGGQTPVKIAPQQPKLKPLRKPPQRFTPPVTAIVPPVAPIVTVGKRSKPATRAQSKPVVAATYNSSGILPTRTAAQQKTRPLRKPPQRFTPPATAIVVPPTPIVVVARRQRPPTRATSRPVLSSKYNGSGVRPVVTAALRRPPAKLRSLSHPIIAAPYNSGGFSPARIVRGVRRLNAPRTRGFSSPVVAPLAPVSVTPLRYYVDSVESASSAFSDQAPSAVFEQEPSDTDTLESISTVDSTSGPSNINNPVGGQ